MVTALCPQLSLHSREGGEPTNFPFAFNATPFQSGRLATIEAKAHRVREAVETRWVSLLARPYLELETTHSLAENKLSTQWRIPGRALPREIRVHRGRLSLATLACPGYCPMGSLMPRWGSVAD